METSVIKDAVVIALDDEELNLQLVSKHLTKAGFEAKCFVDSQEMLEALKQQAVDLLLLDIQMPEKSGIELLKIIRESYSSDQLAVIMLSGVDDSMKTDQCYKYGTDDYILKPFSGAELISRINAVLELKMLRSQNKKLEDLSKLGANLRSN
jgi:DNA-binding response OmpR family regulator